jgi:hypothetical protein
VLPVDVDPELLLVGVEHAGRAANIDLMLWPTVHEPNPRGVYRVGTSGDGGARRQR